MLTILKIAFLFLMAWQGPLIICRMCKNLSVNAMSFLCLAIGITGFVYLQFLM